MKSVRTIIARQSFRLLWLCSLVLSGCGSVTPKNPPTPMLVYPSLSPSPASQFTGTSIPTSTEETYPIATSAPTLTAIAPLQAGQQITLANIYMNDEQRGWGIDVSDHIVHTDDGGHTWKDVTPASGAYSDTGFFALDAYTAWATPYLKGSPAPNNASVWRTYDGGGSWEELPINLDGVASYYEPVDLRFMDTQTGELLILISGEQNRYVSYGTTDAGTHWTLVNSHFNMRISPTPENWSIFQSTDAGLARQMILLPAPNPLPESFAENQYFCDAERINRNPPHTWQVTIQCTVYTLPVSSLYEYYFYSLDSGQTWVSWPPTGDVEFINSLNGWRMASSNGSSYQIEKTQDGGSTWEKIKAVQWQGDLEFVTPDVGWAIAKQGDAVALVSTSDGGRTWQEIKPVIAPSEPLLTATELPEQTPDPEAFEFDSFQMITETVGWGTTTLLDSQGENWTKRILRTSDGGLNWQDVSPQANDLQDFFVRDADHAWVITQIQSPDTSHYTLSIWGTKDAGQTWEQMDIPFSFYGPPMGPWLTFDDNQHFSLDVATNVAAGTTFIQPFRTSDGGKHWNVLPPETRTRDDLIPAGLPHSDLIKVGCSLYEAKTFFSAREGILQIRCGGDLFIYPTYDGGQSWAGPVQLKYLATSLIEFVDMNNGWYVAVEDSPTNIKGTAFYITHDGGKTSSEIIPVINNSNTYDLFIDSPAEALGSLKFINLKTGFAMTDRPPLEYSVILKTTDGGYTWNGWVPHLQPAR